MKNRIHWDEMRKLAIAHQLEKPSSSPEALLRFLRLWWCKTYNRPFKDPLLMSYTADELCYEYLRYFFLMEENDPRKKIEKESAAQDDEDWIKKMLEATKKPSATNPAENTDKKQNAPEAGEPSDKAEPSVLPEISAKFDPQD